MSKGVFQSWIVIIVRAYSKALSLGLLIWSIPRSESIPSICRERSQVQMFDETWSCLGCFLSFNQIFCQYECCTAQLFDKPGFPLIGPGSFELVIVSLLRPHVRIQSAEIPLTEQVRSRLLVSSSKYHLPPPRPAGSARDALPVYSSQSCPGLDPLDPCLHLIPAAHLKPIPQSVFILEKEKPHRRAVSHFRYKALWVIA